MDRIWLRAQDCRGASGAWTRRRWLQGLLALSASCGVRADQTLSISGMSMSTHNFGRYLIDLPAGFELLDGASVKLYFGLDADAVAVDFKLLASRSTEEDFRLRVAKRVAELSTQRHEDLNRPMLIFERSIAAGRQHLIRSFDDAGLTNFFRSDIFAHVGATLVHLTVLSEEGEQEKYEHYLLQVAEQLFPASSERAAQRGFAIGPVLIASKHQQEIASMTFCYAQDRDVQVSAYFNGLAPRPDPSLLGRWDSNLGLLSRLMPGDPGVVRRGKIAFGGMDGEELLTKSHLNDRLVMYFSAESLRDTRVLEAPLIELHLDTEPVGPASDWQPPLWTEKETVAVWDRIVRSVRPRPVAG